MTSRSLKGCRRKLLALAVASCFATELSYAQGQVLGLGIGHSVEVEQFERPSDVLRIRVTVRANEVREGRG